MNQISVIPSFFLYGEAPRDVSPRFLHLETLDERCRPSHWNIRAHAHGDLNHLVLIAAGAGEMSADGRLIGFTAPALLIVPAGVAHGFVFEPETAGMVLTLSGGYFGDLVRRDRAFVDLFGEAAALCLPEAGSLATIFSALSRELAWSAPGHAAAIDSYLLAILVATLRLDHRAASVVPGPGSAARALVARFREAVEAGYRSKARIDDYARQLGVTTSRLRRACLAVAGCAPIRLIQDRLLLEARRVLLYSNMTVSETAYYLGFDDPAYFSRFFSNRLRISPKSFRERAGRGIDDIGV